MTRGAELRRLPTIPLRVIGINEQYKFVAELYGTDFSAGITKQQISVDPGSVPRTSMENMRRKFRLGTLKPQYALIAYTSNHVSMAIEDPTFRSWLTPRRANEVA